MKPDRNQFIGRTLSGYYLQSFLGAGAFAYVYYAVGQAQDAVAVKIQYNMQDDARKRFAREIKVLKQIPPSANITRYMADGVTDEGLPYLVMEYIDGTTLKDSLRFKPQWQHQEACQFMVELCSAFSGMHELGLAHRDVKPENIMLTRDWQVKLMDLGLVKDAQGLLQLFEQQDIMHGRDFAENLDKGVLAGTPEYMAPEQFSDPSVEDESLAQTDTTTDVYSLGLIFYELLAGKKLFPFKPRTKNQAEYARALLDYLERRTKQKDGSIPVPPTCPGPLWSIVERSLRADPKLRQRNASEFANDIRRYIDTGQGIVVQDEERTSAIDLNTFMALHGSGLGESSSAKVGPNATQPLPALPGLPPPGFEQTHDARTERMGAKELRSQVPLQPQTQQSPYGVPAGYPQQQGYGQQGYGNAQMPGYPGYGSNPNMQGYGSNPQMAGYHSNPHMAGYPQQMRPQSDGGVSIGVWIAIALIVLGGLGAATFFVLL